MFLLVLASISPAPAGEIEDAFGRGVAAYRAGDQATALKEFRVAAEGGMAAAAFNLGLMYSTGQGTPKDEAEAVKWWRRAAESGVADAQNNLGLMYENGRGVAQDYAAAAHWYRAAALQKKPHAQHNLAALYANGKGVKRDLVQAHMWFGLAVSGHQPGAARDESAKAIALVERQMKPQEIAQAERLAREWSPEQEAKRQAAQAGDAGATPAGVTDPARARTAAAQAALKKLGYNPGPADGVEGPRTRAAVSAFQRDAALPETGLVTDEIVKRLAALVSAKDSTASTR